MEVCVFQLDLTARTLSGIPGGWALWLSQSRGAGFVRLILGWIPQHGPSQLSKQLQMEVSWGFLRFPVFHCPVELLYICIVDKSLRLLIWNGQQMTFPWSEPSSHGSSLARLLVCVVLRLFFEESNSYLIRDTLVRGLDPMVEKSCGGLVHQWWRKVVPILVKPWRQAYPI